MARFRKPFFRPVRGLWYVWHAGKQFNLGADKDAAFTTWHDLTSKPVLAQAEARKLVVVVVDSFLDFVQKHRNPHTYRWYKDRLQLFIKTIPADLTLDQFKPFHVQTWIDGYRRFREMNLDVGSGRVEAACKQAAVRMKRCGMRWSREGAQSVLSLRSVWLNGQWEQFWGQRSMAA